MLTGRTIGRPTTAAPLPLVPLIEGVPPREGAPFGLPLGGTDIDLEELPVRPMERIKEESDDLMVCFRLFKIIST